MQRKFVSYLILSLLILQTSSNAYAKDESLYESIKSMFTEEKQITIHELVSKTKETKEGVRDLSNDYVVTSIEKYNKIISDIRHEVSSKSWLIFNKEDQEKFNIILDGIGKIKDLYVKLRNEKNDVKKLMYSYIEDVTKFNNAIKVKIYEEENLKSILEAEYRKISSGNISYSSENKQIKLASLQQRITFAQRRIEMLKDFSNNYRKLLPIIINADKSIDKFIFIVDESADVYTDAYNTLKLQKDINNAYRTIEELKSIDYLSENIIKSWSDLDSIVTILTNQVGNLEELTN